MRYAAHVHASLPSARVSSLCIVVAVSVWGCSDGESSSTTRNSGSGGSSGGGDVCEPSPQRCAEYGSDAPFRPGEHTAVHVPESAEMVVFGGSHALPTASCGAGPIDYSDETWIYSEGCDAWLRVDAPGPSRRSRHAAAYGDGVMWVFGGRARAQGSTDGDYDLFDELWGFDVRARRWQQSEPEGAIPSARYSAAMAWDSKRKRAWLFGGNNALDGTSLSLFNDLYSYEPEANRWRSTEVSGDVPSARQWHAMVYDDRRDRLVVFGGVDSSFANLTDTYAFDLETREWEQLHPGGGSAPSERFWSSLVYRQKQDDYLLFGGHDATNLGNRNDLYRFEPDDNSWGQLVEGDTWNKPGNAVCDFPPDFAIVHKELPERRHAAAMIWSSACDRVLLYGGKTDCGIVDDLWSYYGGEWAQIEKPTEGTVCYRWRDDTDRCSSLCQ